MFYGYLDLSWWGYVAYTLIATHVTILAVTIFLHRCQAHRSLELHPIVSHFFRLWLWLTTGMQTKAWAAIHRKHHARCETTDDPHSPQIFGLKKVLFEGAELYRAEAKNQETLDRYGAGTPDDWLEHHVYNHSTLGFYITLMVNIFLLGVPGIIVWAIQMMWIPFFAAGVINGVGHYWGYRNFECPDASTNISPIGILIGGEELHNNHHTYPTSAKLSFQWWEFDIGWLYIRIFNLLGLAKVKRVSPKAKTILGKTHIDSETLRDLIANRFHIMTEYSKSVILPVFKQESKTQESTMPHAKSLLLREDSLVDEIDRRDLEDILGQYSTVQVVYQFRKKLYEIWNKTAASQKELIDALHEWCVQAEETGIQYLQEFVGYIKGYQLQMVNYS